MRRVITRLKDGAFTLPLDNGAQIQVAIRVDAASRSAEIDFTGTSPQQTNNFNAPTAVCMAAVLYVFRTLVDDDIPLNAGCLKPLKVIIPAGSMLNPNPPASVVAGNVETSSCITNALYGALGVMAASQCTMNNFTFGNAAPPVLRDHLRRQRRRRRDRRGGPGGRRLRRHQRRADAHDQLAPHRSRGAGVPLSGAAGQLRDPPGLGRRRALEGRQRRGAARALPRAHDGQHPVQQPQSTAPSAWPAASPARSGINRVVRANGAVEQLDHIGQAEMLPGDVFEIHTPGGGGYGPPG